jgi:hypothetical protein
VVGVQEAIPEKELAVTAAVTAWLYQPFESGARAGVTEAVGVEISTLIGWVVVVCPDGPAIVQDAAVDESCTYECGTQREVGFPPSWGLHVQLSDTSLVYQPALHGAVWLEAVHSGVTV